MAGSHSSGGITGGRMNCPEGSLAPGAVFTGEPPGMPGSPFPADPNDFPRLELDSFPTPVTGVGVVDTALPVVLALLTPLTLGVALGCDNGAG
jgi:hypothetical protein